jgi:hypothetical protein
MLFIELTRIGLELANQYRVASEAAEVERANVEIRGRNMVQWWLDRGVVPRVALVTEDNDIVPNLTQEQIYDILHGRFTGATPTYARVVVTDVSHDERLLAVANLQLEAVTLDDWYRLVEDDRRARQEHGWTPFLRFENRWHTLVWVASDKEYRASFDQEVADRLESLHASLRTNLEQQLQLEAGPASSIKTVRDTSWVGSPNRYVYVYFDSGNFGPIDFGAVTPRFRVLGREWPTNREMTLVQAADTDTWLRLREYRWPTSQTWIGENSSGRYYRRNTAATAYVENDDLVPL